MPLVLSVFIVLTACSSSSGDGRAFLADPSSRTAPSSPTSPNQMPTPPGNTNAKLVRGGIGSTQAGGSGQMPVLAYIDAGHGGVDVGTQGTSSDGQTVFEKNLTLAVATRTQAILHDRGIGTVLSRSNDTLPDLTPADYTSDGRLLTPEGVLHDLQGRIDRANSSGALVLLSIHMNSFTDPAVGGSETFYDAARSFSDDNNRFARLVQGSVVAALRAAGDNAPDRGTTDDSSLQSDSFGALGAYQHLVLLGPAVAGRLRPSQMPGALSEPVFLSNPAEAALAAQPDTQEAIAKAYASAIEQFLRG